MMLFDYAITNAQAETGSLAMRFCSEKGIKYPVNHIRFYTGSRITEPDIYRSSHTFDTYIVV